MPYDSVAVGMPWSGVSPNFQVLITALMRGFGGSMLVLAMTNFLVLFVPFRQGASWALCCGCCLRAFSSRREQTPRGIAPAIEMACFV